MMSPRKGLVGRPVRISQVADLRGRYLNYLRRGPVANLPEDGAGG
jgi:hypothetical protein